MNINEIAKLAGVSRATVSRYLNNGYISEEKRERVQKVIEETGYTPSSHARILRTRQTRLIGVILPKISSHSISRVVAGISRVLAEKDYRLLLANTENDEKKELNYLQIFQENQVDGIILVGTIFTGEHKRLLKELKVPVVIVGQRLEGYCCVYHDDEGAAREITGKALAAGASRAAYIGVTPRDRAAGLARKAGFLEAVKEAGASVPQGAMKEALFTMESGREKAKEVLVEFPDTDTLVCATDTIAIGAIQYLEAAGKRIPEDVQVTGIGDSSMAEIVRPRLSTVHLYYEESGSEGAAMLLEMLSRGETAARKELKMGYFLKMADSTR